MASAYDPTFDRLVMAGPIVDNANDRLWGPNGEYDGPRCAADDCDTAVEDDGDRCEDCADLDHQCTECGTDVSRPGLCFDCDVRASYVGGLAPRFGAEA